MLVCNLVTYFDLVSPVLSGCQAVRRSSVIRRLGYQAIRLSGYQATSSHQSSSVTNPSIKTPQEDIVGEISNERAKKLIEIYCSQLWYRQLSASQ